MSKRQTKAPLRVMELFAGVGGARVALQGCAMDALTQGAGFEVVWSSQFEPATKRQHASEVYVHRFGPQGHSNEDFVDVVNDPQKFAAIVQAQVDVLVGGFPCQDYSVATNHAPGLQGAKGALWWSIAQCLRQLQNAGRAVPYLLFETVDRLLKSPTACRGQDYATILASLSALGYAVEWRVINAADYGFGQRRRRVFMLCYHRSTAMYAQLAGTPAAGMTAVSRATRWVLEQGVMAKALPVDASSTAPMQTFDIGQDCAQVAERFKPCPDGSSPFENCGLMLDGKVYSVRTRAAPMEIAAQAVGLERAKTLGDIVAQTGSVAEEFYVPDSQMAQWQALKGAKVKERVSRSGHAYTYSEGAVAFPDPLERASRTIVTGEGGPGASRFKHVIRCADGRLRRLVPEELEALNGFARGYTAVPGLSDTKRAFLMGNSLVVGIVAAVGRCLLSQIDSLQPRHDDIPPTGSVDASGEVTPSLGAGVSKESSLSTVAQAALDLSPASALGWDQPQPFVPSTASKREDHRHGRGIAILARQEARRWLLDLDSLEQACRQAVASESPAPRAVAVTILSSELEGILDSACCSARALVVLLPSELEPYCAALASQRPQAVNWTTTDLRQQDTYAVFKAGVSIHGVSLWLPYSQLVGQEGHCGYDGGTGEFFTVLMCAGNTVAMGGYYCDADHLDSANAAVASVDSYQPSLFYSDAELALATARAARDGPFFAMADQATCELHGFTCKAVYVPVLWCRESLEAGGGPERI